MDFALQLDVHDVAGYANRYSFEDTGVLAIGRMARARGYYTRGEFIVVCRWKTPRSKPLVAQNGAGAVRTATEAALHQDAGDIERMRALRSLRGVDWATGSVLLHLTDPDRFPIVDVRTLHALGITGSFKMSDRRWKEYVDTFRRLVDGAGVDGRTVDRGLWAWSAEQGEAVG